jgi:hypothetical protein
MKTLSPQQKFLNHALPELQKENRIFGLAARNLPQDSSFDLFSRLDLCLLLESGTPVPSPEELQQLAKRLGQCLASFAARENEVHCLFEEPLLEVRLRLSGPEQFAEREENPLVVWEREGRLTRLMEQSRPSTPRLNLQEMENRFWLWLHAGACFLAQGEIFSLLGQLEQLRQQILIPLAIAGPHGMRRATESVLPQCEPEVAQRLCATIAGWSPQTAADALRACARLYLELRERQATDALERNRRAELCVMRFLHEVGGRIAPT